MTEEKNQQEGLNLKALIETLKDIEGELSKEAWRINGKSSHIKMLLNSLELRNIQVSNSFEEVVEEGYQTHLAYGSTDTYIRRYHVTTLTYNPQNRDMLSFECGAREDSHNHFDEENCYNGKVMDTYSFSIPFTGYREIAGIVKTKWLETLLEKAIKEKEGNENDKSKV